MLLTAVRIFTGEAVLGNHSVLIEQDRIVDILPPGPLPSGCRQVRLPDDWLLSPGFIDIQVNGGGGVLFNDAPTIAGALAIAAAHRPLGTTSLLPTVISDDIEVLFAAASAAAEATRITGSGVVGVHIEGPFLNPKRRGAHPEGFIRPPSPDLIDRFCALPALFAHGARVLITLAPEIVSDADIGRLTEAGVIVSGGHSAAGIERTRSAIAAGLRGFTHLFNAMPPIGNRTPGIALAALESLDPVCGLIVDGIHVHPALLSFALRSGKPGRFVLVSDAMPCAGTDLASFDLLGRRILRAGGRLTLEDGTLAGADLDLGQAVRNAVSMLGIELEEALRMASLYPARFLGLDATYGRLAPGCRADLVALDAELAVRSVWMAGVVERAAA